MKLIPTSKAENSTKNTLDPEVRQRIRERGRRLIAENQPALRRLAEHERAEREALQVVSQETKPR